MDAEVYKQYIPHVLSDVAERRTIEGVRLKRGRRRTEKVQGETTKTFIRGEHICYQGVPGLHDSDAPLRLTMAVTAAERLEEAGKGPARGNHNRACILVAEHIMASPCERLRNRFLKREGSRRREALPTTSPLSRISSHHVPSTDARAKDRLQELNLIIADQNRANASRRNANSPLIRLAGTVRTQVARFRRKNPDWRSDFDFHLANFRFTFYRDADWYSATEREYENWLSAFESHGGVFDWYTAMPAAFLAEVYHEQGKYAQALRVYRKTILFARRAMMPEDLRAFVVRWLRVNVKACLHGSKVIPCPPYPGELLPREVIVIAG